MTEPQDPTQLGLPIEPTAANPLVDYPPTGSEYAWSADDGPDDPPSRFGPKWITVAAVATCVVVIAVAVVVAYRHLADEPVPAAAPLVHTTVTAAAPAPDEVEPPPPPPVRPSRPSIAASTLKPPPPRPAANPGGEENPEDLYFLTLMRQDGWYITNTRMMVDRARKFCALFRQGTDVNVLARQIAADNGLDLNSAYTFTGNARIAYSGCTYGGR